MTFAAAGISIRNAQPADAPAICALLKTAGLSVDAVRSPAVTHRVAIHNGTIVGVAALETHGRFGLLRSVAVAPEWRRAGIAAALVRAIEPTSGEISALYLFTETAESFFARLGFAKVERSALPKAIAETSQALGMCPTSATVMRRDVLPRTVRVTARD